MILGNHHGGLKTDSSANLELHDGFPDTNFSFLKHENLMKILMS